MSEQPGRPADLRAPIPTLEADDAFVALLASRAVAGAPLGETGAAHPARTPVGRWQVGLAAAAVALIMIGAAWLTGLHPEGTPDPAPPPATPPTVPTPSPVPTQMEPPSSDPPASEPARAGAQPSAADDTDDTSTTGAHRARGDRNRDRDWRGHRPDWDDRDQRPDDHHDWRGGHDDPDPSWPDHGRGGRWHR